MKLPDGAKIIAQGKEAVLAYGEVTGHAHRVTGENVALVEYDGRKYVVVDGVPALLDHEEHGKATREVGQEEVVIQREQAWDLSEEIRPVVD